MIEGVHQANEFDGNVTELIQQLVEAESAVKKAVTDRLNPEASDLITVPVILHRAQEALRQGEIKYQALLSRLPAIVSELSPDGTILYANEAVTRVTGYRPEELKGKNWWRIFYPGERRRQVAELCERFKSGPVTDYEMILTARDGSLKTLIWDSDGPREPGAIAGNIIGIGVDITESKRKEETLSEVAALVESSDDAITAVDLNQTIVSWNGGAERLYGYTAAEAKGQPVSIIFPPDRSAELSTCIEKLERGEHIEHLETVRVSKDGTPIDVSVRISPVRDTTGRMVGFSGIARDITRHRRTEEALRESEARFRLLADNAQDLIYRLRLIPELRFEYASPVATTISGYSPEEYYNNPQLLLDRVHPDDLSRLQSYLADPVSAGREFEMRWLRKDGRVIWTEQRNTFIYDENGRLVAVEGIARDITERKRAEEMLRQREREVTALLNSLPAYAFFKDKDGFYITANQQFCDAVGCSQSEIAGKTDYALSPRDLADKYRADDAQVVETGEPLVVVEEQIVNGQDRVAVSTRKVPIKNETGAVVGLIGLAFDITERKQMEEKLIRAQRLETVWRIASQVAHDFNNLLGPLAAYPELIKRELPAGHPSSQLCDSMTLAAKRIAEINQDLLTLGRRGHFEHELLDFHRVIEQAIDHMPDRPPSLMLELDLGATCPLLTGSAAQLLRVISNLLSNAREAMQEVGLLTVRTRNVYVDRPFQRYDGFEAGEYIRLDVSDTGSGIPTDIKDKVFEAFFTTKTGKRRGSGLGLTIVQTIVHDHRGYLDVVTEIEKGTTFSIYFPVSREKVEVKRSDAVRGGTEAILVIDDDEAQREVMGRILQKLGYRVKALASGEEAIVQLRQEPADLLIVDMTMSTGIDGLETFRRALKLKPGLPAIILSGLNTTERVRKAQVMGAGTFLRKPVTLAELARAVREELDRGN